MPLRFALVALLALTAALASVVGCTPAIGDSCNTAFDCSINGDRQCDVAQPMGSCTVFGCEADTCPDEAVCVRWRPEPSRLAFNACMKVCETDSDCRIDQGFVCMRADEIYITADGMDGDVVVAENIDEERGNDRSFCVSTDPTGGVEEM